MSTVAGAIASIRAALAGYVFRARSEADLQAQVVSVLVCKMQHVTIDTEVRSGSGRYDIALRGVWSDAVPDRAGLLVLELKVKSSATAVERQALRYAQMGDVAAVVVVTTSLRLAAQLAASGGPTLGGKPFAVIALRSS